MKRSYPYSTEFNDEYGIHEYQLTTLTDLNADPIVHWDAIKDQIGEILNFLLNTQQSIWIQLKLKVKFEKKEPEEISESFWFQLPKFHVNQDIDISEVVSEMQTHFVQRIESHQSRGSGWIFYNLDEALLKVSKHRPLTGATYIPTPKKLKGKRALINVENTDQACFQWSILSARYPATDNTDRVSNYTPHKNFLNMDNIPTPTPLCKKVFERFLSQNPSVHLNVYLFDEDDGIIPFFCDPTNPQKAIDLLFLPHRDSANGHYVWIKHFSRLISDVTNHRGKKLVCRRCFAWFTSEDRLNKHLEDCSVLTSESGMKKMFPHCKECDAYQEGCSDCEAETIVSFKNFKAKQPIPAFMVADFESYLKPVEENTRGLLHHHHPISFGIKVVVAPPYRQLECFRQYVNQHVIVETNSEQLSKKFLEKVLSLGNELYHIISNHHELIQWDNLEKEEFLNSWICHICEKPIGNQFDKVADHDHLTGRFRGPAHNSCNLNYNFDKLKIPVVLHNYRGYDSKMIMQDIGKLHPSLTSNLNVLAQNSEQFKTMSLGRIRFIDSFLHLPSSLCQLVKNLAAEVKQDIIQAKKVFHHLASEFGYLNDEDFSLLLRKGVFPYTWLDDPQKLKETELPGSEAFFNELNHEAVTPDEYEHAQKVWSTITTMDGKKWRLSRNTWNCT